VTKKGTTIGKVRDLKTGETSDLKHAGGRPSSLTPEVHRRVVALFANECSVSSVASAAGIPLSTMKRWLTLGRQGHPTYETFALDVEAQRNLHKTRWMRNLELLAMEGGAPGVRATLALLSRQFPEEWGDRDTVAVDEHASKKTAAERLAALPADKRERARELIKLLGESSDD
jgi:hypothetical protein